MKTYSLEELTDTYIGEKGTKKREAFETELRLDLLGLAIKQARQELNLKQEVDSNLNFSSKLLP